MRCPTCNEDEDKVIDSRSIKNGSGIRRRRECLKCHFRYTTYEYLQPQYQVVKRSGGKELFNEDKMIAGISAACKNRPIDDIMVRKIVEEIEEKVFAEGFIAQTKQIGELVLSKLKELDNVSYVRFASVYKGFNDLEDFNKELSNL